MFQNIFLKKTLADGTYATQSALVVESQRAQQQSNEKPLLRRLLLDSQFFIASAMSNDLTKLVYRYAKLNAGIFWSNTVDVKLLFGEGRELIYAAFVQYAF